MIQRFFFGFGFIIEGARLLRVVPGLSKWLLAPVLIDFIMLGLGIYFGADQIHQLVARAVFMTYGDADTVFSGAIYYSLSILFWIVFIILFFYFIYLLASVIASPFYSVMTEKTLAHLGAIESRPFSFRHTVRNAVKMFWVSLLRGFILTIFGAVLLMCSFLPGLNLLASFSVFLILTLDAADYAFEAKKFGLKDRFRFFRDHLPEFFGMGSFVGLTAFIPGLILLLTPLAVVGAAGLVSKNDSKQNS